MSLSDKIPVPELDELRVARIERNILAELQSSTAAESIPTPRSYRSAVYAMVAVAGLVFVAFVAMRGSQVELLDKSWSTAEATEVATGPGQRSSLRLGDALIEVGESTQVSVQRFSDGRTVLHLSAGSVNCEVQPRPHRPTFQVVSGDVNVTVVGTAFEVKRSQIVEVKVERGIVSVETSFDEERLVAGDSWQGSPFANTSLASILAQQEKIASAYTLVTDEQGPPKPETKGTKTSKPGKTKVNGGTRQHIKSQTRDAGMAQKTIKLSEVLKSAKPLLPIYKPSHGEDLRKLKAVARRNPKEAVKLLQSYAAMTTGDDASFALYARAYLLFFKLKQYSQVVKTAKQYARRFPRGAESEDILWLRVRASCGANKFSSCRAAAHSYLQRYPKGIFQGLASRIVTTTKTE